MLQLSDKLYSFSDNEHPINLAIIEGGGGENERNPKGTLAPWADKFKNEFNVFRIHYPLSTDEEGYTTKNQFPYPIESIKESIKLINTYSEKPLFLLGHSMGATYAVLAATTEGLFWGPSFLKVAGVISINGCLNWGLSDYDVNDSRVVDGKEDNFYIKHAGARRDDLFYPQVLDATSYIKPDNVPIYIIAGEDDFFFRSNTRYYSLSVESTINIHKNTGHFHSNLFAMQPIKEFIENNLPERKIIISGDFELKEHC